MCRNCSPDWDDRKYMAKLAMRTIKKKYGPEAASAWLWNETPFPVSLPSWDQIAEAL